MNNEWDGKGLPPVGCECDIKHAQWSGYQWVKIMAITGEYVIAMGGSGSEQHYYLKDMTFRPIKSQADVEIDKMVEDSMYLCDSVEARMSKDSAKKLNAKGYRLMGDEVSGGEFQSAWLSTGLIGYAEWIDQNFIITKRSN